MYLDLGTSFIAGILGTLSPCVLPLAPILLFSAWQQHKLAPLGLIAGLCITFTTIGLMIARTGQIFMLSPENFRLTFVIMLLVFGIMLVSQQAQNLLPRILGPITRRLQHYLHHLNLTGIGGQFIIGLILGCIWLPCTGPTLGLASSLASQGNHMGQAIMIMAAYSLGISLPLILISYVTRSNVVKSRHIWLKHSKKTKSLLGYSLIVVSLLLLTGYDHVLEEFCAKYMPNWLVDMSVKY